MNRFFDPTYGISALRVISRSVIVAAVCLSGNGCSTQSQTKSETDVTLKQQPTVVVTNSVVEYFVKTICDDSVTVVKISDDGNSEDWRPSTDDVSSLQSANLILLSGANYETWVGRVSLPRSRVVDTSATYADWLIRVDEAIAHKHGPGGAGSDSELAWATWLDPELARQQLATIEQAIGKLAPQSSEPMVERCNSLSARLEEIDQRMDVLGAKLERFKVSGVAAKHAYLVRCLGVSLVSSEADANSEQANIDFALVSMNKSSSQTDPVSVKIDVCDQLGDSEDLLDCMAANLERLEVAVESQPTE